MSCQHCRFEEPSLPHPPLQHGSRDHRATSCHTRAQCHQQHNGTCPTATAPNADSPAVPATNRQDPPPPVTPPPQELAPLAYPPLPTLILEASADPMNFTPSNADLALKQVYGDWLHNNLGLDL